METLFARALEPDEAIFKGASIAPPSGNSCCAPHRLTVVDGENMLALMDTVNEYQQSGFTVVGITTSWSKLKVFQEVFRGAEGTVVQKACEKGFDFPGPSLLVLPDATLLGLQAMEKMLTLAMKSTYPVKIVAARSKDRPHAFLDAVFERQSVLEKARILDQGTPTPSITRTLRRM